MKTLSVLALSFVSAFSLVACVADEDTSLDTEDTASDVGDDTVSAPELKDLTKDDDGFAPYVACGFTHNQLRERGDWYRNCLAKCMVGYAVVNPVVRQLYNVQSKYFRCEKGASCKLGNVGNFDTVHWIRWC